MKDGSSISKLDALLESDELSSLISSREILTDKYVKLHLSEEGKQNKYLVKENLNADSDISYSYDFYHRPEINEKFDLALTNKFNVKLRKDVDEEEFHNLIKELPVEIVYGNLFYKNNRYLLKHDHSVKNVFELVPEFESSGLFTYLEPDFRVEIEDNYTPNDPLLNLQWPVENTGNGNQYNYTPQSGLAGADMNVKNAWDITTGNPSIKIAIMESDGVELNHPNLSSNIISGYDVQNSSNNGEVVDNNPHATMVAGLAGAKGDNNEGIAGICYDCSIMPVRLGAMPSASDIAEAVEWAFHPDYGDADVINMSFGVNISETALEAVEDAGNLGRCGKGTPMVAAAGNNNNEYIEFPATAQETFAISGTNMCDELWHYRYNFTEISTGCFNDEWPYANPDQGSSFGEPDYIYMPTFTYYGDGINFAAPATQTISTDLQEPQGFNENDDYVHDIGGGTSMSAPLVSGTIGLMLTLNDNLTLDEIEEILAGTTDKITSNGQISSPHNDYSNHPDYDHGTWNKYFGYGRINTGNAVDLTVQFESEDPADDIIVIHDSECDPPCIIDTEGVMLQSPMGDYGDIKWYRDGEELASDYNVIEASEPGKYEVKHNGIGCGSFDLRYCCDDECPSDSGPGDGDWVIEDGHVEFLEDGIHRLSYSSIIIEDGGELSVSNSEVILRPCTEIIVEKGGMLNIEGSTISSCSYSWRGIKVIGDNSVSHQNLNNHGQVFINDSELQNAYLAIYSLNGGYYNIEGSDFRSNYSHLKVEDYPFSHTSSLHNNSLFAVNAEMDIDGCPSSYSLPNIDHLFHKRYLNVNVQDNINNDIIGLEYDDKLSADLSYGISAEVSNLNFEEYEFEGLFKSCVMAEQTPSFFDISESHFEATNTDNYINIENNNDNVALLNNTFIFLDNSSVVLKEIEMLEVNSNLFEKSNIFDNNEIFLEMLKVENTGHHSFIGYNDFQRPSFQTLPNVIGVQIDQVDGNTSLYSNQFFQLTFAAIVLENSQERIRIAKNLFDNNEWALQVATHEMPFSNEPTSNVYSTIDFDIFCNKFFDNTVGILGSGDIDHGDCTSPDPDDIYTKDNMYHGNSEHDIIWDNNGFNIVFCEDDNEYPINTQNGASQPINGQMVSNPSDAVPDYETSNYTNCYGNWSILSSIEKQEEEKNKDELILATPIPFTYELKLSRTNIENSLNISIYDATGSVMYGKKWDAGTDEVIIDVSDWTPGFYFIRYIGTDGTLKQQDRLIKQE